MASLSSLVPFVLYLFVLAWSVEGKPCKRPATSSAASTLSTLAAPSTSSSTLVTSSSAYITTSSSVAFSTSSSIALTTSSTAAITTSSSVAVVVTSSSTTSSSSTAQSTSSSAAPLPTPVTGYFRYAVRGVPAINGYAKLAADGATGFSASASTFSASTSLSLSWSPVTNFLSTIQDSTSYYLYDLKTSSSIAFFGKLGLTELGVYNLEMMTCSLSDKGANAPSNAIYKLSCSGPNGNNVWTLSGTTIHIDKPSGTIGQTVIDVYLATHPNLP